MPSLTNNKEQAANSSHKVEAEDLDRERDDCKGETDDQDDKANEVCGSCCSPPPLKRKQERCYTQQYSPVGHCSSLVFLNHFLLKWLTVRSMSLCQSNTECLQSTQLQSREAPSLLEQHRTPSLLTCLAEKGDRVQHRTVITPSNSVSVRHPQPSEQIGHTTADSALYHYSSCSTCKFTKPLPCTGKCESRQEGTPTGDNCREITVLSAQNFWLFMTRTVHVEQN